MLRTALFESDGPVAIRYPRGGEGNYTACSEGPEQRIRTGSDVTIVSYGLLINEALSAADSLEDKGLSADVIKINRIAGDVYPLVMDSLKKTGRLVMAEEVCAADCLGTSILAQAEIQDVCLKKAALLNLGDGILPHGDRQLLLRDRYLDAQAIAEAAIALP